jgi:hypothetical protein
VRRRVWVAVGPIVVLTLVEYVSDFGLFGLPLHVARLVIEVRPVVLLGVALATFLVAVRRTRVSEGGTA